MNEADTEPRPLTLPERVHIARSLRNMGLGDLRLPGITTTTGTVHHGKQFGCICDRCTKRPDQASVQPAQPWEPRPAKRAA